MRRCSNQWTPKFQLLFECIDDLQKCVGLGYTVTYMLIHVLEAVIF